jgi:hypothetical protein
MITTGMLPPRPVRIESQHVALDRAAVGKGIGACVALHRVGAEDADQQGAADSDTLLGDDGNGRLDSGARAGAKGNDFGDDVYFVNDAGDVAAEVASGFDTVRSLFSHTLSANLENATLTASSGVEPAELWIRICSRSLVSPIVEYSEGHS